MRKGSASLCVIKKERIFPHCFSCSVTLDAAALIFLCALLCAPNNPQLYYYKYYYLVLVVR